MDQFLGKKYKLVSSEKFDEFMKALGVSFITRKMGGAVYPVVELRKGETEDEYIMLTSSTFKNQTIKFKPGVEFDEDTPDGRQVKSIITFDGNNMLQVQKGPKTSYIERVYNPTEMVATMKVDDVVCTRVYKVCEDKD